MGGLSLFAPLPAGPFAVLYADPPWKYDFVKVRAWGPEVHYPTLALAELLALPVAAVAGKDAALFLWVTSPKLPWGLALMEAWGFTYKTSLIWDKGGLGMGYWVRVNHELLLIGTRGKVPCPAVPCRPASVLRAKRRRHSEKPAAVYGIIEGMVPQGRRLELFARGARAGWEGWGLEAACCD